MAGFVPLAAKHFLSCLEEGDTGTQQGEGCGESAAPRQLCCVSLRQCLGNSVVEGVVIMAGDIIDNLAGVAAPGHPPPEAFQQMGAVHRLTGDVARQVVVKHRASQRIPQGVIEECKFRQTACASLDGQGNIGLCRFGFHVPALTVENAVGVLLAHGADDFANGLHVDKPYQVKPEAVDVVFVRPVIHGIHNEFAYHGALRGSVVAAAGAI